MVHRRRRLRDLVILVVGAAVLAVIAGIGSAAGDTERIASYWAGAQVAADRTASIVEVIDYEFGVLQRHGIYRDVPGLRLDASIEVESPTAPDQFTVAPNAGQTRIRIGDPERTITGRHRYVIDYPVGIGFDEDIISWNATGDQWTVGISDIEIHLTAPARIDDPFCSKGARGSWGGCTATQPEPGHLVVRVGSLDAGEGITVSGRLGEPLDAAPALPAPPAGPADDPGAGIVQPALVAGGVGLATALIVSRLVRRAGREYVWSGGSADAAFGPGGDGDGDVRRIDHDRLAELATTEFAPPAELTAWQGGVLLAERTSNDHEVAWLVEQAIDGEIQLEGEGRQVTLRRDPDRPPGIDVVSSMFGGRDEIDLSKYDSRFAKAWERLARELDDWHRNSGLWERAGDERRTTMRILSVIGLVVGVAGLVLAAVASNRWDAAWLFGVGSGALLAGAAGAALTRSWELRVRTPEGSGLWLRVESFRRFIADSDAHHAREAADKGVLLQYTAWAVALGEVDHWSAAMERAGLAGSVDPGIYHLAAIAPSLGRATSSAATAPSSSGGGGGSVGGGGGGGGGGSW